MPRSILWSIVGLAYCIATLASILVVIRRTASLVASTHSSTAPPQPESHTLWSEEADEVIFDWLVSGPSEWAERWLSEEGGNVQKVDEDEYYQSQEVSFSLQHSSVLGCEAPRDMNNLEQRDFSPLTCQGPIDAVYTWVNGSEPFQQELLRTWQRQTQLENETLRAQLIEELLWKRWLRNKRQEEAAASEKTTTSHTTSTSAPERRSSIDAKWIRTKHSNYATTPKSSPGGDSSPLSFLLSDSSSSSTSLNVEDLISEVDKDQYENQAGASRFADHDELRYSIRSLEMYGGWVRHIYLVTNGQVPTWLNLSHPKITVITHEQIFENAARDLPTFSSNAIESHLHLIPNLSKRFLYFNDDTFFAAPVALEDFYSPTRGHRIYESWQVPSCHVSCPSQWLGDGQCDNACNKEECAYDLGDCSAPEPPTTTRNVPPVAVPVQDQRNETAIELNMSSSKSLNSVTRTVSPAMDSEENFSFNGEYCYLAILAVPNATHLIDPQHGCKYSQIGDGVCQAACDRPECGFDAMDCAEKEQRDFSFKDYCAASSCVSAQGGELFAAVSVTPSEKDKAAGNVPPFVSFAFPTLVVSKQPSVVTLSSASMPLEGILSLVTTANTARSPGQALLKDACSLAITLTAAKDIKTVRALCLSINISRTANEWVVLTGSRVDEKLKSTSSGAPTKQSIFMRELDNKRSNWREFLHAESVSDDSELLRKLIGEEKVLRGSDKLPDEGTRVIRTTEVPIPPTSTDAHEQRELKLPLLTFFSVGFDFSTDFPLGNFEINRSALPVKTLLSGIVDEETATTSTTAPANGAVRMPESFITSVSYALERDGSATLEASMDGAAKSDVNLNITKLSATFLSRDNTLFIVPSQALLRKIRTESVTRILQATLVVCGKDRVQAKVDDSYYTVFSNVSLFLSVDIDPELKSLLQAVKSLEKECLIAQAARPFNLYSLHASASGRVWNGEKVSYEKLTANLTVKVDDDGSVLSELLSLVGIVLPSGQEEGKPLGTKRHLLSEDSAASVGERLFIDVPLLKPADLTSADVRRRVLLNEEYILEPSTDELTQTTGRKMADLFGDSLKHTNMLLTQHYGAQVRKVPAHMVHLIDREAVADMWKLWGHELNATSSSRFRSKHNIQFALAHFYHIAHAAMNRSFADFLREEVNIVGDFPSPASWFTYSETEYRQRYGGEILPTLRKVEEFRRLAVILWDEDLVDPDPNKQVYGRANLHVVKIDPPYLDRRKAKERNEDLVQRLVSDSETEWIAYDIVASPAMANTNSSTLDTNATKEVSEDENVTCVPRFMSALEMATKGPWAKETIQSSRANAFLPQVNKTAQQVVDSYKNQSLRTIDAYNGSVLAVERPFGCMPPATTAPKCTPDSDTFAPYNESVYNVKSVNRKLIATAINRVISSLNGLGRSVALNTFLTSLQAVENRIYFGDIYAPRSHQYINATLDRQEGFLALYKGLQRDSPYLGTRPSPPVASLQRNREADDALPMTDRFLGGVLWLSHVASLKGSILTSRQHSHPAKPCQPIRITEEFATSQLAVRETDLRALESEPLSPKTQFVFSHNLSAAMFEEMTTRLKMVSRIIPEDLKLSLNLLFHLQSLFFAPTVEVPFDVDAELSSYLYSDKLYLPVTLSYIVCGLLREEFMNPEVLAQHCKNTAEVHITSIKAVLSRLNARVKEYDEEAAEAARILSTAIAEKPRSLYQIAAAGNMATGKTEMGNWRGRRFGVSTTTQATTTAPKAKASAASGYYDEFFDAENTKKSDLRIRHILQAIIRTSGNETSSAHQVDYIAMDTIFLTSASLTSTLASSEWPLPPPLHSDQLENSLFGAVMIGVAERNTAQELSPVTVPEPPPDSYQPKQPYGPARKRKLPPHPLAAHYHRRSTAPLLYNLQKYNSETISVDTEASGVTFSMVRNNVTVVRDQVDHIRSKRPKFLCINDDMDHSEGGREEHLRVMRVLKDFFEGYFPRPSIFERTDGQTNPFTRLSTEELKQIDYKKRDDQVQKPMKMKKTTTEATTKHPKAVSSGATLTTSLLMAAFLYVVVSTTIASVVMVALVRGSTEKRKIE